MVYIWIFCVLFTVFQPTVICKPALRMFHDDRGNSHYNVEYESKNSTTCEEMVVYKWYSDFHECFIDRKYKDGGQNLNNIVDRILEHAETCVQKSRKDCLPDFNGFKVILNKVLEQMKDYSVMYLENIIKGRENVRDLACVEETLSLQTYERCFETKLSNPNLNERKIPNVVQEGLLCANRANRGCSSEAKTTLNKIVRTLLGAKHPSEEYLEEEPTTTPAPPPMKWYDYIFQPFVSAWKFIKSLFG